MDRSTPDAEGQHGDQHGPGMAIDAEVYVYKVFTHLQESYTAWFLDALNHAIFTGVHIVNLSVGSPDSMDMPFADKVRFSQIESK